jgi:hypothetical protein
MDAKIPTPEKCCGSGSTKLKTNAQVAFLEHCVILLCCAS